MWPFKQKSKDSPLMMVRYTYDVYKILFPDSTEQEWKNKTHPDNVSAFIKTFISKNYTHKSKKLNKAIIVTIDQKYIDWLGENNKKHSSKMLGRYLTQHENDVEFWNERLVESKMNITYNVLGIPSLLMLYNFEGSKSEYVLSKKCVEKITETLKYIYNSEDVFVPGWITKGCDMPRYIPDIIQIAKSLWDDGIRIRYGQYLEQNYERCELINKFVPLHFVVPFVVKSNITSAAVNLSGLDYTIDDKFEHAMASIKFSDKDRINLFQLISNEVKQIVSIGSHALMPGQAYIMYRKSVMQNAIKPTNIFIR